MKTLLCLIPLLLVAGCASLSHPVPQAKLINDNPIIQRPPIRAERLPKTFGDAAPAAQIPITLAWDYPTNALSNDLCFILYRSSDLSTWSPLMTIPGTNLTVTFPVVPAVQFYQLTSSNFWGESLPSNRASTPAPPLSGFPVKISR